MTLDITQPMYMTALAENGSITKAARQLGVSQPAISNWLKNIEEQLGVRLVIRSKKQLILTPAGKIYLEGAKKMIEVKNQTYRDISQMADTHKEVIRITGTPNGGAELFASLFQDFRNRYPSITLQFLENYNSQSLRMIKDGTADLGLCSTIDLESDIFEFVLNKNTELILMVPEDFSIGYDASHLRKDEELPAIHLSQLEDVPFIMPAPEMSYYNGLLHLFKQANFHPDIVFQSANVKVIYSMIKNGNGAGILPRRLFSPLDRVSPFSLAPKLISHSILAYKKGRILTPAEEYIIRFLQNHPRNFN